MKHKLTKTRFEILSYVRKCNDRGWLAGEGSDSKRHETAAKALTAAGLLIDIPGSLCELGGGYVVQDHPLCKRAYAALEKAQTQAIEAVEKAQARVTEIHLARQALERHAGCGVVVIAPQPKALTVADLPKTQKPGTCLFCDNCRGEFSSCPGDYFACPPTEILACSLCIGTAADGSKQGYPLRLVRRHTVVSDL